MGLFSVEENKKIIKMFDKMRVTDTRDGMDWCGMMHYGTMDYGIKPLERGRKAVVGIAKTCRYVPYDGHVPFLKYEEYSKWSAMFYKEICNYPWRKDIQEGDFIVIDQSNTMVGLMGSNNALECMVKGAVGLVSNGGVRDTDEVVIEKIPFWSRGTVQPMVQGRIKFDAMDIPVEVGGVVVNPGDVIVADGDGVIVVPRAIAADVAKWGGNEMVNDKAGRRKLYEAMGLPFDETV